MNSNRESDSKDRKLLPVWALVVIDIAATCVALGLFAFFHLVVPGMQEKREAEQTGYVYTVSSDTASDQITLPEPSIPSETEAVPSPGPESVSLQDDSSEPPPDKGGTQPVQADTSESEQESIPDVAGEPELSEPADDWKFASLTADGPTLTEDGYASRDIRIRLTAYDECEGVIESPYTVADLYVRDVRCLQTYFAGAKYIPTGHGEPILQLMEESGAIFAANGDYYSMQFGSAVLRNGILYRYPTASYDVFVLYDDGSVQIVDGSVRRTNTAWDELLQNAWQAWSFGPSLLDETGKAYPNLQESMFGFIVNRNPRTGIGYFEPGHYCMVVVDGRSQGAAGATFEELAAIFESLGCTRAYNLDGGGSSVMAFNGEIITNQSTERKLPDIILVAEYEGSFAQRELEESGEG